MNTKKVIWKLKKEKENLQEGLDYIERLKKDENVLEVLQEENQLTIILEDK